MEVETAETQLLKDSQLNPPAQKKELSDNKEEYSVEKILDRKVENGQKLYLIKWEGYPASQSTWEPVENLLNVIDIIVDYEVRECTRQEEKEHGKTEDSPKNQGKRKTERSLSGEGDLVKKVKVDNADAKEKVKRKPTHEEEDEEDDDEEDDKENMRDKLNRRRRMLNRLKAFQGKEFSDQETLAAASKKINMTHPFVVESVNMKDVDMELSESEEDDDDASDAPKKRGRGRPRKTDKEREEGTVKKRGRPPKAQTTEEHEGEAHVKKRGPGRPRKNVNEEEAEDKEEKTEKDTNGHIPRKRGRPRKKEEEDVEDSPVVKEPRKRGRPRKDAQDQKHKDMEDEESDNSEEKDEEEKEGEKADKGEEGEKMKDEGKEEGEEKGEKEEGKEGEEGASPTAFVKARTEAVLKRRGVPVESKVEEKAGGENVVKRGRGRPRKNVVAAPVGDEENEESEQKKETEEGKEKEEKEEEDKEEGEGEGSEEEEGEEEEEHKPRSTSGRKRGRPRKDQQRKRGRPRKEVRVTKDEEEKKSNEGEGEEEPTVVRKRGRPRKNVPDVNKENYYQTLYTKSDQEDQGASNQSILGVRSEQANETEAQQKKQAQAANMHKFGSLNEKDIPKKIIKARVVTDKGCIFLIEWEKRQSGEQPQNSHVTSHELKNFDPSFLLEYYEEIAKKSLKNKKLVPEVVEPAPRDEDMIPVEQNPEKFGSFAFHDNPKEIVKVKSADQDGWEFLVRWEPRTNNIQPLDSVVNNEALKLHDPNFLISFYESKIKAKPGEEAVIILDILDQSEEKEPEQGDTTKNTPTPLPLANQENVIQQEPIAQE